jgi:hypothetical protein
MTLTGSDLTQKDEANVEQIEANTEILLASWVSCNAQSASFDDLHPLFEKE